MKKILLILSCFISYLAIAQVEKAVPSRPSPPTLVNDFTGSFLTPAQREALEQKLVAYNDSTSTQIVIVVVNSLDGYEANEYSVALGRKWGIGNKDFNNGVVILVSTGDKEGSRDAYIATGYGMEGAIPDVTANRIVDNEMIPNFKEGNFYRGLDETVNAIFKAAAGEYKAPAKSAGTKSKRSAIGTIIFIIIMLVLILGGGKRGGGTYVSRGGFGGWAVGSILGSLSNMGGGSGGGGGGFGGFGGGSFGGGGAGGKW